jgi:hypothetical protein
MITNKIIASLLLSGLVVVIMFVSWIALPRPFVDLVVSSIPIMLMIGILIFITVTGATLHSRIGASAVLLGLSPVLAFIFSMNEWSIGFLLVGMSVLFDVFITVVGCKSPMEQNATGTFATYAILFATAFAIGFFFEILNETVLHIWDVTSMDDFYPMIEIINVNLIVVFTWTIVGIVLFEAMLLVFIVSKRVLRGKENACILG